MCQTIAPPASSPDCIPVVPIGPLLAAASDAAARMRERRGDVTPTSRNLTCPSYPAREWPMCPIILRAITPCACRAQPYACAAESPVPRAGHPPPQCVELSSWLRPPISVSPGCEHHPGSGRALAAAAAVQHNVRAWSPDPQARGCYRYGRGHGRHGLLLHRPLIGEESEGGSDPSLYSNPVVSIGPLFAAAAAAAARTRAPPAVPWRPRAAA